MPKMKRPNGTIASVVEKGVPHLIEQGYTLVGDSEPPASPAPSPPAASAAAPPPAAPAAPSQPPVVEPPPAPPTTVTIEPPAAPSTATFDVDGTDDVDALRAHAESIGLEIPGNVSRVDTIRERIKAHQADLAA